MSKTLEASFILTGTIIGAGVLGLPYAIEKAGFFIGVVEIFLLGFLILMTYLMFGESVLRIKEARQFPGIVERYIGKKAKHVVSFLCLASTYGAMTAYVQGSGDILVSFGVPPLIGKLLFFIPFSIITFFGVKGVDKGETLFVPLLIIIVLIISVASLFYFKPVNLTKMDYGNLLSPLGVILFAFSGFLAIPQMKEVLWLEKKNLKKSILIGFSIPLFLYIFFVFSCIGALGEDVSGVITIALGQHYGSFFSIFCNIFAFLAMATCFISLGNSAREIYNQDYNLNKNLSFFLAISPSLIALTDLTTFTKILSLTGGLFIAPLTAIIVLLFYKTKRIGERRPEYEIKVPDWLLYILTLLFLFISSLICIQEIFY